MSGFVDEKTAQKTGNILGVKYLLIGSYQKENDEYVVNARIVKVESAEVTSTEKVKGENIFDLENEISLKIAKGLGLKLSSEETAQIKINPATNIFAYRYFSQGAEYYYKKNYKQAKEEFNKAIKEDPNYTEAKLWLSTTEVITKVTTTKIPRWKIGFQVIDSRGSYEGLVAPMGVYYMERGSFPFKLGLACLELNLGNKFSISLGSGVYTGTSEIQYSEIPYSNTNLAMPDIKQSITLSAKYYLSQKGFQPYFGIGIERFHFAGCCGEVSPSSAYAPNIMFGLALFRGNTFSLNSGVRWANYGKMKYTATLPPYFFYSDEFIITPNKLAPFAELQFYWK